MNKEGNTLTLDHISLAIERIKDSGFGEVYETCISKQDLSYFVQEGLLTRQERSRLLKGETIKGMRLKVKSI